MSDFSERLWWETKPLSDCLPRVYLVKRLSPLLISPCEGEQG